jgi:hypothetical protein
MDRVAPRPGARGVAGFRPKGSLFFHPPGRLGLRRLGAGIHVRGGQADREFAAPATAGAGRLDAAAMHFHQGPHQHIRWDLNDLARRLDEQPPAVELREGLVPVPASSGSGLTPVGRRMLAALLFSSRPPQVGSAAWAAPSLRHCSGATGRSGALHLAAASGG